MAQPQAAPGDTGANRSLGEASRPPQRHTPLTRGRPRHPSDTQGRGWDNPTGQRQLAQAPSWQVKGQATAALPRGGRPPSPSVSVTISPPDCPQVLHPTPGLWGRGHCGFSSVGNRVLADDVLVKCQLHGSAEQTGQNPTSHLSCHQDPPGEPSLGHHHEPTVTHPVTQSPRFIRVRS